MTDYVDLGSAPCDEPCVEVSDKEDYLPAMRAECNRYLAAIRAKCGNEVGSARLRVKSYPHDFGTYLEVICSFDENDDIGSEYAWNLEDDAPRTWDDTIPAGNSVN